MNKLSLSVLTGVVASGTIAAYQPSAHAASFSFSAQDASACVGLNSCNNVNGFFSLDAFTTRNSATPVITTKEIGTGANKTVGLGVDSSDPKNGETGQSVGEIDVDEILKVGFKKTGVLSVLDLSFLYRNPTYGDEVFEVALVTADDAITKGTLTVTGTTSATWSLGGLTPQNLSPSLLNNGGSYRIFNPFGDLKIKGFSLTAVPQFAKATNGTPLLRNGNPYVPTGAKNSDFMLSRVEVTKVPEPATLLGLGVVGLAAFARRRQVAKAD